MDNIKTTGSNGFTLLEVIVALAIFSTVGVAALSWLNTSFISLQRISRLDERANAVANSLELLKNLNPTLHGRGDFDSPQFHVTWQSEPYLQSPNREKRKTPITVYKVSMQLVMHDSGEQVDYSFFRSGYE